jgi:hypothetical protein
MDSGALAKLSLFQDWVEVCDEAGEVVGFFHPAIPRSEMERMTAESPFSEEELQRIWGQPRSGQPLSEIRRELAAS